MSIALKPWAFAIICSFMSVAAANGQTRAARAPSRPAVPDAASVQRPPAPPVPAAAPTPPAPPAAAAPLVPPAAQTAPAPPTPPAPPAAPVPPLKVLIVISRYQGEKKVASMPYTLSIGGGNMNRASVRMGGRIPIVTFPIPPTSSTSADNAKARDGFGSFQYQDIGTNLDCVTWAASGGRYRLDITIDDTSVYPEPGDGAPARGTPTFRTFRTSDSVVVRDGETTQVTSAVDKVTGEVVKIDVTLTVVK